MDTNRLLPKTSLRLSGRLPGSDNLFRNFLHPTSRFGFLINKLSFDDEQHHLRTSLQGLKDDRSLPGFSDWISSHLLHCRLLPDFDTVAYKLPNPPPPPPPPIIPGFLCKVSYVCFFTRNEDSRVRLSRNGEALGELNRKMYVQKACLMVVRLPRGLKMKKGETLTLGFEVSFQDKKGNLQSKTLEYIDHY